MSSNVQNIRKHSKLQWTRAAPCKQKDQIVSSDVILNHEKGFTPSYEKDSKEFMCYLMTEEYMRIWFKERGVYENTVYTKKQIQREQAHIHRRFVQRDWCKRTVRNSLPIIELKRFQDIPSKTDHGQFRVNVVAKVEE